MAEIAVVNQTRPHLTYVLISTLGFLFDIIAVAGAIFLTVAIIIVAATWLLPVATAIIVSLGNPMPEGMAEFYTDTRNLLEPTLIRIPLVLLPLMLVFARERIARPFRSRSALFLAIALGLPSFVVLIEILANYLEPYFIAPVSLTGNFLAWLLEAQQRTGMAQYMSFSLTLAIYAAVLSGALYLPYAIVQLVWGRSIGRIRDSSTFAPKVGLWRLMLILTNSVLKRKFWYGLSLLVIAAFVTSAFVAAFIADAPTWFLRHYVPFVMQMEWIPKKTQYEILGYSEKLFWPCVILTSSAAVCLVLFKPRMKVFLFCVFAIWVIPALLLVVGVVIPTEQYSLYGVAYIVFTFWLVPFLCFVVNGYRAIFTTITMTRKSEIKKGLTNHSSILFLRNFALDSALVKRSIHLLSLLDVFKVLRTRLEEVVVREAFLRAPVFAVANPREHNEPPGAIREYLSNSAWQPFVSVSIRDSRAIIFLLGAGRFTDWETRQIVESGALSKVLFIVPPDPRPALDYLAQNDQIASFFATARAHEMIASGNVRGFSVTSQGVTMISNRFKSELAYILATNKLLELVGNENA